MLCRAHLLPCSARPCSRLAGLGPMEFSQSARISGSVTEANDMAGVSAAFVKHLCRFMEIELGVPGVPLGWPLRCAATRTHTQTFTSLKLGYGLHFRVKRDLRDSEIKRRGGGGSSPPRRPGRAEWGRVGPSGAEPSRATGSNAVLKPSRVPQDRCERTTYPLRVPCASPRG